MLHFSGPKTAPFILLCEAKLWSGKSGLNENDQLLRYLKALRSLERFTRLRFGSLDCAATALLYITPRDSLTEVLETASQCVGEPQLKKTLFRAQWQDISAAADESLSGTDQWSRQVMSEVSAFLKCRGLEYFRGFASYPVPTNIISSAVFYESRTGFTGFDIYDPPESTSPSLGYFYSSQPPASACMSSEPAQTSKSDQSFRGFDLCGCEQIGRPVAGFYISSDSELN